MPYYGTSRVYKHDHPEISIVKAGGKSLGRCFSEHYYRVTTLYPLTSVRMHALRNAGFLGYGQGFCFRQILPDGTRAKVPEDLKGLGSAFPHESGHHYVQCSEVDDRTGEVLACPSINPYTEEEDKQICLPYYVYEVIDTVDSGD